MQKRKVVLLVISIGVYMILFLLMIVFFFSTIKEVEDVPITIFSDINELDSIPELTSISRQINGKDGDYDVIEKREYLCEINNKKAEIKAYVFVRNEDAKRKFCVFANKKVDDVSLSMTRDYEHTWITNDFGRSKYCVLKGNCLLYAETKQGQKVIAEIIKIFGNNLSVVVDVRT